MSHCGGDIEDHNVFKLKINLIILFINNITSLFNIKVLSQLLLSFYPGG